MPAFDQRFIAQSRAVDERAADRRTSAIAAVAADARMNHGTDP
jgi:hypothetical protein